MWWRCLPRLAFSPPSGAHGIVTLWRRLPRSFKKAALPLAVLSAWLLPLLCLTLILVSLLDWMLSRRP